MEVVDDEHFKLSHREDEHLYRVDIVDVTEDHCGKIRVIAKNENGEDSKEVRGLFILLCKCGRSMNESGGVNVVENTAIFIFSE